MAEIDIKGDVFLALQILGLNSVEEARAKALQLSEIQDSHQAITEAVNHLTGLDRRRAARFLTTLVRDARTYRQE